MVGAVDGWRTLCGGAELRLPERGRRYGGESRAEQPPRLYLVPCTYQSLARRSLWVHRTESYPLHLRLERQSLHGSRDRRSPESVPRLHPYDPLGPKLSAGLLLLYGSLGPKSSAGLLLFAVGINRDYFTVRAPSSGSPIPLSSDTQ